MKKVDKFERGYLSFRKNRLFLSICINILIGIIIFVIGMLLNNFDARNIFSVIALLFTLPMARSMSTFLVLLKYRELKHEELNDIIKKIEDRGVILYSPVFSSSEEVMGADLIYINKSNLIVLVIGSTNTDKKLMSLKHYLEKHIKNQGEILKVSAYVKLDDFIKDIHKNKKLNEIELNEIKEFAETMKYFTI